MPVRGGAICKGMLRDWQRPGAWRGVRRVYRKEASGEWETAMGRGRRGGGQQGEGQQVTTKTGRGQRRWGEEAAREGGNSQMDMMECLGGHRL